MLVGQINPHFFMNMLNNVHALVEIDPKKAQKVIIGLSKLMRHSLYEADKQAVALSDEIKFMLNDNKELKFYGSLTIRITCHQNYATSTRSFSYLFHKVLDTSLVQKTTLLI